MAQVVCAELTFFATNFLGRRIYVSLIWTCYGGSRCYWRDPASRSLCGLSLGSLLYSHLHLFPSPLQSLGGRIEVRVRLSLASFFLTSCIMIGCSLAHGIEALCSGGAGVCGRCRFACDDGGEEEKQRCAGSGNEESGAKAVEVSGDDACEPGKCRSAERGNGE